MAKTKTWIQTEALNPRSDMWDWEPDFSDGEIAVTFKPFGGVYPIYCDCVAIEDGKALLRVPPKSDDDEMVYTNWFPGTEWQWVIVPEIYLRPQ